MIVAVLGDDVGGGGADLPGAMQPDRERADPILLANDAKLYDQLAALGFTGPAYDRFAESLASYGLRVVQGWLRSGLIFSHVRTGGSTGAAENGHASSGSGWKGIPRPGHRHREHRPPDRPGEAGQPDPAEDLVLNGGREE